QMPLLRQEEERRHQARLGASIGAALSVIIAITGMAIYALQSNWKTQRALDDSLFAASNIISTTARQMPRSDSLDSARSALLNQTCDLRDMLADQQGGTTPRAETAICLSERAF